MKRKNQFSLFQVYVYRSDPEIFLEVHLFQERSFNSFGDGMYGRTDGRRRPHYAFILSIRQRTDIKVCKYLYPFLVGYFIDAIVVETIQCRMVERLM
jgi:hypothetical protein